MLRIKRGCDVVFSALGLVVLSPLFLLAALFTLLTVRGSAIFVQTRIGYKKREFRIFKFRTMSSGETEEGRAGAVGRLLRRTKLDELPQLVNVLRGDMSFVGPRPYVPEESRGLPDERFSMRPGLTGLAQVNGNRELSWEERTAYDLDYVRGYSLGLDARILLKTVRVVLLGEKAVVKHRAQGPGGTV